MTEVTVISGDITDPLVVADGFKNVTKYLEALDHNVAALTILMAAIVARGAPAKDHPLRRAAADAIYMSREAFPDASMVSAFERLLEVFSTPPPTDGDGLSIDSGKIVDLFKKAA